MKISAAMCTREIKIAIAMEKATFNKGLFSPENWNEI